MIRVFLFCCVLLGPLPVLRAEGQARPPLRLTLTPAKLPTPVLRYALLPDLRRQVPGNAAVLCTQAIGIWNKLPKERSKAVSEQFDKWEKAPLSELPRAEVRRFLDEFREVLALVKKCAHSEQCDWGDTEKLRQEGYLGTPLLDIVGRRDLLRLVLLQARLELAEGQPERSVVFLRCGFALARQVGEGPTLLRVLVGIAYAQQLLAQLEEILTHPATPDLYWSLTDLPQPFLDLRRPLEGERVGTYGNFPGLYAVIQNPAAGPVDADKAQAWLGVVLKLEEFGEKRDREALLKAIESKHDLAKRTLIAQGRPRKQVEAMPEIQVALLHLFLEQEQWFDEMTKWQTFPCWQALTGLYAVEKQLQERRAKGGQEMPALSPEIVMPWFTTAVQARGRVERRIAALRCVEALRLHAANNGGKWPAGLAEVKDVPIPIDPLTGKSFLYEVKGERAILRAPEVTEGPPNPNNSLSYELTLRP